jgi:flagellar basal body-associated protein FliL
MSSSRSILIIIIGIAFFVLGGGYILFSASPSVPVSSKEGESTEDSSPASAERQFLSLVASLEPTHLDTKLLSDIRFTSLSDIREPVAPEASGRLNPFAAFSN